ncbi:hypothetical protein C5C18_09710 [Rathayibacter tritici]|nr:hypothetical protein C5C21_09990 [Rathayibacter tritici]PPG06648.1 hypothetical protein C5C18_09710 [Rathayibacter tritici]
MMSSLPDTLRAPAMAPLDELRSLLRSALDRQACHDGTNPVAAFIAIHPVLISFLREKAPGIESVIHLAQELRVLAGLWPGIGSTVDAETIRCLITNVRPDARGSRVTVATTVHAPDGAVTMMAISTILLGGVDPASLHPNLSVSPTAPVIPRERVDAVPLTGIARVSSRFSTHYALVSNDDNPIHVDPEAARAAGFGRAIAHGMSIVALALEIAADELTGGDVSRITAFGVRFSAPVLCDSDLVVEVTATQSPTIHALKARTATGLALKSAWIEISAAAGETEALA